MRILVQSIFESLLTATVLVAFGLLLAHVVRDLWKEAHQ